MLVYFIAAFVADWMPTLGTRSAFNYAMLVIPVAALLCALAGLVVSLRRLWRRQETALDVVVIAGAFAHRRHLRDPCRPTVTAATPRPDG